MDDSVSRFWDKYISKTKVYKVPERARQWYVRRVEAFINAHAGRKLAALSGDDVRDYLDVIGRNERIEDWQFKQSIEALRILFVELVRPAWVNGFDWAIPLPTDNRSLSGDEVDVPATGSLLGPVKVKVTPTHPPPTRSRAPMSNLPIAPLGLTALRGSQAVGPNGGSGKAFLLQLSIAPHRSGAPPGTAAG